MTVPGGSPDVVVVGGGIVGVCTALQLRRAGREVTLIERGVPGDEASGHNGGAFSGDCLPTGMRGVIRSLPQMLRDPMSPLAIRWRYLGHYAPWLVRFALSSRVTQVERIGPALGSLTTRGADAYRPLVAGTEVEGVLHQHGLLFGYLSEAAFQRADPALDLRSRSGVEYELLDADTIGERHPVLHGRFERAVYLPRALFTTDPQRFTRELASQFVRAGGRIRQAEVRDFDVRDGSVQAVRTTGPDGPESIAAGAVVICAGPWSRQLLRRLGTNVPLRVERGYGVDLPDPGIELDCPVIVADHSFSLTPHGEAGVRLTGMDELAGLSAPPDFRLVERIVRAATSAFPELRTAGGRKWMRSRPSMPDSLPVIGRAPRQDNVYLAFGHGHKGLGMGAITGKLLQELMDGQPPSVDLAPFSPTRFSLRHARSRALRPGSRAAL